MNEFGKVVAEASRAMSLRSRNEALTPILRAEDLPSPFEVLTDREIPDRVVAFWRSSGAVRGDPQLRRALTADERGALVERRKVLERALMPAPMSARDRLLAAISGMLGGFPNMQRHDADSAAAIAAGYLWVAREYPWWAIERACEAIRGGKAGQNTAFCPTEPEFAQCCKAQVLSYRARQAEAEALLSAGLESEAQAERPSYGDLKAKYGVTWGLEDKSEESAAAKAQRAERLREVIRRTLVNEYAQAGIEPIAASAGIQISLSLAKLLGRVQSSSEAA